MEVGFRANKIHQRTPYAESHLMGSHYCMDGCVRSMPLTFLLSCHATKLTVFVLTKIPLVNFYHRLFGAKIGQVSIPTNDNIVL